MSLENVKIRRKAAVRHSRRAMFMAVLAATDPQIVWNEAENFSHADGNPYIGPQAVLSGVFARVGNGWDGFTIVPDEIPDVGDTVVMRGKTLSHAAISTACWRV